MSVLLRVWGDYACFTRPEFKAERFSYDVMTPSAARGIVEAVYRKPEFKWEITGIYVVRQGTKESVFRNELKDTINSKRVRDLGNGIPNTYCISKDRMQRNTILLRDVEYIIQATIVNSDNIGKHYRMFRRRASNGRCFTRPYFGCREFVANFELVESVPQLEPKSASFGYMFYDWNYGNSPPSPMLFNATMDNSYIAIPSADSQQVLR